MSKIYDIKELLELAVKNGASDLHLTAGLKPHIRIDGLLKETEYPLLQSKDTKRLAYSILNENQIKKFEEELELDLAFGVESLGRFRINLFLQRGSVGAAVRVLPFDIMNIDECGLPADVVLELCALPKGLILVAGATGSGKSTTLAAMIEKINQERNCHIVTLEDPIEFIYRNKKAIVDQREVMADTLSFNTALRHVLRQDPNVILIGEMRDLETIEAALNIAETGHLVFATLHTSDSAQTINRIIDVFPEHKQEQVRTQLSFVLQAVFVQQLIPKMNSDGRLLAYELLRINAACRALIRENKVHQLNSTIQTSHKEGMRTMNKSLHELVMDGEISKEEAMCRTTDPAGLAKMFEG